MHIYSAETATVEIPDMEKIENAVRDSRSPYYYPDLMKKYLGNDTTMTLQDFRHLYLGYASQEDYNPNRNVIRLSNMRESPYPIYLSIYDK